MKAILKDMDFSQNGWYEDHVIMSMHDSRVQVKKNQISTFPYNCIGLLCAISQDKQSMQNGTAFLISPNLIVTAASNILNYQSDKVFQEIYFYPGLSGLTSQSQYAFKVDGMRFPSQCFQFKKQEKGAVYDYALLHLSKKINLPKYLQLESDWDNSKSNMFKNMLISGYPNEKLIAATPQKVYAFQYKGHGQLKCIENNIVYHLIDTTAGQMGSPILFKNEGQFVVIGIHKGSPNKQRINIGVLLTDQIIKQILIWESQFSSSINYSSSKDKQINQDFHSSSNSSSKIKIQRKQITETIRQIQKNKQTNITSKQEKQLDQTLKKIILSEEKKRREDEQIQEELKSAKIKNQKEKLERQQKLNKIRRQKEIKQELQKNENAKIEREQKQLKIQFEIQKKERQQKLKKIHREREIREQLEKQEIQRIQQEENQLKFEMKKRQRQREERLIKLEQQKGKIEESKIRQKKEAEESKIRRQQAIQRQQENRIRNPIQECIVCCEKPREMIGVCYHICICEKCSASLKSCPICNTITRWNRIYIP